MNKNKLLLLAVVITYQLINVSTAFCLDLGFSHEDGGRPGAFLSYGAGARSLAMGKTFVGVADDASTTYWNPAGLATLQKPEITALYASMYEKTGYSFASGVYPLKSAGSWKLEAESKNENQEASSIQPSASSSFGTLGLAIVNLSSRGFQLRDEYNYEQGEGGVSETAAIASYGTKVPFVVRGSWLAVGANLKVVNQNVNAKSDTGYGIDVGALTNYQKLNIGLSVQNLIAPKLTLIEDTDKYPLSTTLGFSYRFFNNNLLTALDLNKTENRQLKVHLGTEYTLAKLFSIRAGLDETEATFGMGVKWQNYSLDYAFAYHDAWKGYEDLGISHRFGLTVRFGK